MKGNGYLIYKKSQILKSFHLPYIRIPAEFLQLLKKNMGGTPVPSEIFKILNGNPALILVMGKAFTEFDDGRGIEKVMSALGWSSFRDRLSSLYVSKALYGKYSEKTDLEIINDIKEIENRFQNFAVSSFSRLFLLGFYIKLSNIKQQTLKDATMITIPENVERILSVVEGKSERIDWLILIISHLCLFFDEKLILNHLSQHKKIDDLYELMSSSQRQLMFENLLNYGASIGEQDFVLYAKI